MMLRTLPSVVGCWLLIASTGVVLATPPSDPIETAPPLTFTQAIDRASDHSQQLHAEMEAHFDRLRSAVSEHMTTISEATLQTLLLAIEAVEQRQLHGCDNPAAAAAEPDFGQLGTQLSRCALLSDIAMQRLTGAFYDALAAPQDTSLDLLSLVLDHVGRANPLQTPAEMAAEIQGSVDAVRQEFEERTVPALGELVEAVGAGRTSVPAVTGECVAPVLLALECH